MVKYSVSIGAEAQKSLRGIYYWLQENESSLAAKKVTDGILNEIAGLSIMPERHGLVPEIQNDQIIYRRILKWSYKIIFTIDEEALEVLVVDIVHTKQNPKLLREKFGN